MKQRRYLLYPSDLTLGKVGKVGTVPQLGSSDGLFRPLGQPPANPNDVPVCPVDGSKLEKANWHDMTRDTSFSPLYLLLKTPPAEQMAISGHRPLRYGYGSSLPDENVVPRGRT